MLFITLLAKPYVGWLFISWIHNLRHCSLDQFIQDFIRTQPFFLMPFSTQKRSMLRTLKPLALGYRFFKRSNKPFTVLLLPGKKSCTKSMPTSTKAAISRVSPQVLLRNHFILRAHGKQLRNSFSNFCQLFVN